MSTRAILLLVTLAACGPTKMTIIDRNPTRDTSVVNPGQPNLNNPSDVLIPNPDTSSKIPTSPPSLPSLKTLGPNEYATANDGVWKYLGSHEFTIDNTDRVLGFTSFNGKIYYLLGTERNYSITNFRFYKYQKGDAAAQLLCNISSAAPITGGIILTSENRVLALKMNYLQSTISEINLTNCTLERSITLPPETAGWPSWDFQYRRHEFNFDFFDENSLLVKNNTKFFRLDLTSLTTSAFAIESPVFTDLQLDQVWGTFAFSSGKTSNWFLSEASLVSNYANFDALVKYDKDNRELSWAKLPRSEIPDLQLALTNSALGAKTYALAEVDDSTIAITTIRSTRITIHYFDVTEF